MTGRKLTPVNWTVEDLCPTADKTCCREPFIVGQRYLIENIVGTQEARIAGELTYKGFLYGDKKFGKFTFEHDNGWQRTFTKNQLLGKKKRKKNVPDIFLIEYKEE